MSNNPKPKIFISYSHESNEWKEQIRLFVNGMRIHGLDCIFDKYTPENPLWSNWMREGVYNSDYIFIFCTKSYKEKFITNSQYKNSGVYAEAECIRDRLKKSNNEDLNKIFLLFFGEPNESNIPTDITRCHRFNCSIYEQFNELYHRVTNQIKNPPEVGDIKENLPINIIEELKYYQEEAQKTGNILERLIRILKEIITLEQLKLYATNLLSYSSIHLPEDFDSIIEHLYDYRYPLLCLLKQLDDNRIGLILKELQEELHISDSDLEKSDYMKIDMKLNRCNLLITLEPENDDTEHTKVEIWKIKQYFPHPQSVYGPVVINLSTKENPTALVDKIFELRKVSRNNVLIEFIIPYELQDIDFASWYNSNNDKIGRRFKIVRRLSERLEKSRIDNGTYEDWKQFWDWYKAKKSSKLKKLVIPVSNKDDISFDDFEEKPYIKCKNVIDFELYKGFIEESACIILASFNKDSNISELCSIINEEEKLEGLIKASFKASRNQIPYILIWDNPNRIPLRNQNKKTASGE